MNWGLILMVVLRGRVLFHSGKGAYASQYQHLQSKHLVQPGNSIRILTNGVKLGQTPHSSGAQEEQINRLKQGNCLLFGIQQKVANFTSVIICPCAHNLSQFLWTLSTVLHHVTFRSPLGKHSPGPGQLNGSFFWDHSWCTLREWFKRKWISRRSKFQCHRRAMEQQELRVVQRQNANTADITRYGSHVFWNEMRQVVHVLPGRGWIWMHCFFISSCGLGTSGSMNFM